MGGNRKSPHRHIVILSVAKDPLLPFRMQPGLQSLMKRSSSNGFVTGFVKGHGFSRAEKAIRKRSSP